MLRLALIGCGEHSQGSHAVPLARYASERPGEICLAAACDLKIGRAEEFCREYRFARAYDSLDKMLAEEKIDGCVCIMPMERIAEVGIKLLEMGMPCVIEKPLGVSMEEIRGLLRLARETGTPHMVSVNRRFMPYLNQAISWAEEMGPLRYVRGTMIRNGRREPDFIWSTAIHGVDALRYIAGEVRGFKAEMESGTAVSPRWYSISFRFLNGALGQLEVLPTGGMVEETYELFGDGYRASVLSRSGRPVSLQCWRENEMVLEKVASEPDDVVSEAYGEVIEFVRALKTGSRPRPSIEDVYPSAEICFQIAERAGHRQDSER